MLITLLVWHHLPRASGKFTSHVFAMITGNGLAQVITVLGTFVLARLFSPDAFGSFALFLTVVSFLSVLGGARYELAIMLAEKTRRQRTFFSYPC